MIDNFLHNSDMFTVMMDPKPYLPTYNNNLGVGQLRYNPYNFQTEVYDGNTWVTMSQTATLHPGPRLINAINWVEQKQMEERELESLMQKHPGLKEAKERFDIMLALVKDHNCS